MRTNLFFLFFLICIIAFSQNDNARMGDGIQFQNLFSADMRDGVSCYRIPAIVTAPNGDLVAAIDERVSSCGDLKWNDNINIVLRRSTDNGNSWSEMETVVDYPAGQSASDPSMIVDKMTGKIFLFFNFMDLVNEKDVYYLRVVTSSDNGKSWSRPRDITTEITPPEWRNDFKFITSGRGTQTRSGKLLHTLVNLGKGVFLFGSDNHGESWYWMETPVRPADESKIAELADGTWMINSRVNGAGMRFVHTSADEGKTWVSKPDSALVDAGCNASFIRLSSVENGSDKNRLLFSNVNHPVNRENMTVRISYDEGKSWSAGKTIYTGSSAYSSMTVLQNGDVVLFFEKDDYTQNGVVRFSLEWLTDGKDKLTDPNRK